MRLGCSELRRADGERDHEVVVALRGRCRTAEAGANGGRGGKGGKPLKTLQTVKKRMVPCGMIRQHGSDSVIIRSFWLGGAAVGGMPKSKHEKLYDPSWRGWRNKPLGEIEDNREL